MKKCICLIFTLWLALSTQLCAYAQLPVAPNQYQPQGNFSMGVAPNLVPMYVPSWIGAAAITATKTLNDSSECLQTVDASLAPVTVTLSNAINATNAVGKIYCFKAINVSNLITISAKAGDTIDGSTSVTMTTLNGTLILESDGTHTWRVISTGGGGGGGVSSVSGTPTQITSTGGTTPVIALATNTAIPGSPTTTTQTPGTNNTSVATTAYADAAANARQAQISGNTLTGNQYANSINTAGVISGSIPPQLSAPVGSADASLQRSAAGMYEVDNGTVGKLGAFLGGKVSATSLQYPPAPVITQGGTPAGITVTYAIAGVLADGTTTLANPATTTTSNNTLTGVNFNTLNWTAIPGVSSYNVYRTRSPGSPSTLGLIGNTTSTTFNDTGFAGNGLTVPTVDYTGQVLAQSFNNPNGQTMLNPAFFPAWRTALARVRTGTGNAEVQCWGDSTTAGLFGPNLQNAYPWYLQSVFTSAGIRAGEGMINGRQPNAIQPFDTRVNFGSWSSSLDSVAQCIQTATASGTDFTLDPGYDFDTIRLFVDTTSTATTATLNVDGGATLITILPGTAVQTATVPLGRHTVHLTCPTSVSLMKLYGFECYDSTQNAVRISNLGVSGDTAASFQARTPTTLITAMGGCDLVIYNIGINDWTIPTSISAFKASLTTTVKAVRALSNPPDLVLMTPFPSGVSSAPQPTQAQFVQAIKDVGIAENCPVIDYWSMYNGSNTFNPALTGNTLHQSALGYSDEAACVGRLINFTAGNLTTPGAQAQYLFNKVTTVAGSAGNINWSMPQQGVANKKVLINLTGYTAAGTTTITFPTPFVITPSITFNDTTLSPAAPSTTSIVIPISTTKTGNIIVEGF